MDSVIPQSLRQAVLTDSFLPVIGPGYPDFVSTPLPAWGRGLSAESRDDPERAIADWLDVAGPHIWPVFQAIAELEPSCVMSLTLDQELRSIFHAHDPHWVTLNERNVKVEAGRRPILSMVGSRDDLADMLVSELDFVGLAQRRPLQWAFAQQQAARAPLVVIGCDPADSSLRALLSELRPVGKGEATGWLLCQEPTERQRTAWEAAHFEVVSGGATRALFAMLRAARDRGALATSTPKQPTTAQAPYKGLDYFERHDAGIFYGRRAETKALVALTRAYRMVIVTGASGVGKTSLINAGLLAWTDAEPNVLGVYVRCGNDPIRETCTAVAQVAGLVTDSHDLRTVLERAFEATRKIPLIVLDQAEELLTRIGPALRNEFIRMIRDCVLNAESIGRFIFSLREDYLARLSDCREVLPSLLVNSFRVNELERPAALDAICEPAAEFGVTFDRALAERILDEIASDQIAPPQIQIVCTRLFEACNGSKIDEADYKALGGAREILRTFLLNEVEGLGHDRDHARTLLRSMVTSEGTKDALTLEELTARSRLPVEVITRILSTLRDRSLIVRSVHDSSQTYLELAHEYLTREIWTWMSEDDVRERAIDELLTRELRSWRYFPNYRLGADRLELIERGSTSIQAEEERLRLLLLSSVQAHRPAEAWVARFNSASVLTRATVVHKLLENIIDRPVSERREAAEALAMLRPVEIIGEFRGDSPEMRRAAIEAAGGLELPAAVTSLVELLNKTDTDAEERSLIIGALGEIRGAEAGEALAGVIVEEPHLAPLALKALVRMPGQPHPRVLQALSSRTDVLHEHAYQAIRNARGIDFSKALIESPSLSDAARQLLWRSAAETPGLFARLLASMDFKVTAVDRPHVMPLLHLVHWERREKILKNCQTDDRPEVVRQAAVILTALEKSRDEFDAATNSARFALVTSHLTEQLVALLDKANANVMTAIGRVLRNSESPAVEEALIDLLAHESDSVRAASLFTLSRKARKLPIPDRTLSRLLEDKVAIVRYSACGVAQSAGHTRCLNEVRALVDDVGAGPWYDPEIGTEVKDAARSALNTLHPVSLVWRKPFQRCFTVGSLIASPHGRSGLPR